MSTNVYFKGIKQSILAAWGWDPRHPSVHSWSLGHSPAGCVFRWKAERSSQCGTLSGKAEKSCGYTSLLNNSTNTRAANCVGPGSALKGGSRLESVMLLMSIVPAGLWGFMGGAYRDGLDGDLSFAG